MMSIRSMPASARLMAVANPTTPAPTTVTLGADMVRAKESTINALVRYLTPL
eukprot:m.718411 g.718411  ORF g.718411 m.718411 type:complete len:52 (-) comp22994_c2_seq2:203-358(-)